MLMSWCDGLSVGVSKIDREHQSLTRIVDLLRRAAEVGDSRKHTRLLELFQSESAAHFAHEEQLMQAFRYPRLFEHRAIHQKLLTELDGFRRDMLGRRMRIEDSADYLSAWLTCHIQRDDMPLYYFMKTRLAG